MGFTAKGAPAHGVAAFAGPAAVALLTVAKDSPIASVADLKGTQMGVTTAVAVGLADQAHRHDAGWGPEGINPSRSAGLDGLIAALRPSRSTRDARDRDGYQLRRRARRATLVNAGKFVTDFHTHVIFARDARSRRTPIWSALRQRLVHTIAT